MPYTCTLSPELQKKALDELNEKPETRERDIQALRDKVKANKALTGRTDDAFLLRFLRARKFDVERAYALLVNYYTIRAQNAEYFKGLRVTSVKKPMDDHVTCVLPLRDAEGRRVIYFRPGRWDPTNYTIYELLKLNTLTLEKVIEDEATQVNGVILLGDFSEVGIVHARNIDRTYARLSTSLMQDAFPMRLKAIHAVNEPSIFGMIFSLIKPFLKEKTANRMNFHGSSRESLFSALGEDLLPEELGGKAGPAEVLAEKWNDEMRKSADALDQILKENGIILEGSISDKKTEKVDTAVVTGTFKKLNVD